MKIDYSKHSGKMLEKVAEENLIKDKLVKLEIEEFKTKLRKAVANYMRSEGCSCCRDTEAHEKHTAVLAKLLDVPAYDDDSGFEFYHFADK